MRVKELFYVANIIDYLRIVSLYWAVKASSGYEFAAWYSFSYLLDAIDGYAARALDQESRLGYYLDMVIDRISSCLCLHFAANAVQAADSFVPVQLAPAVVLVLRACIVVVEIAAHGIVMFLSEVLGVHQKQMGYDYALVRNYLSDKRFLAWGCISFEGFSLGLIMNCAPLVLVSLPGFAFRAAANVTRLIAILPRRETEKGKWPVSQYADGEMPRRGASDRLGHHRAASPSGAQVLRRTRSGSASSDTPKGKQS